MSEDSLAADAPEGSAAQAADAPELSTPESADGEGAAFPLIHDPFAPHLRFASHTGMRLRPWMERPGPRPLEPIDTQADKLVDFDALEALASFRGLFKVPVEMHPDNYPSSIQDQMRELEPQFILRNLGRVERMNEGQKRLPVERHRPAPGIDIDAIAQLRLARYESPELLDETNLDVVSGLTAFRRRLYRDVRWERHFSREIREDFEGPMWRYQPPEDAPTAPAAQADVGSSVPDELGEAVPVNASGPEPAPPASPADAGGGPAREG